MNRSKWMQALAVASSAYVGWTLLLVADVIRPLRMSFALLGELCFIALVGSIPTALVLGAARRVGASGRTVTVTSTFFAALLTVMLGWEHTDFLLSGPQWIEHPRRDLLRLLLVGLAGVAGAGGWLWVVWGTRVGQRRRMGLWLLATALVIAVLTVAMRRFRAYDYSMAQLVFPAALLSAAAVHLLFRRTAYRAVLVSLTVIGVTLGLVTRLVPSLAATGQRELVAHGRASALVTLYVLPRWRGKPSWIPTGETCPEPKPVIEDEPLGIAPDARRNVILITVDALRNDVIEATVDGRAVMPELSRWARRGLSFQNATTTYPATLFAMGSAFTGLSPAELYLSPGLPETIFTRSRQRVERQIVVWPDVSWFRLPIVSELLAPGIEAHFATTDARATDAVIARLRSARAENASVIAWVHYYSPHDPYVPQAGFSFGATKKAAYLSEVGYFDAQLGRLLEYLHQDGWLEDSLVIFFSDHGEALGERSYWGHHVYLDGWMVDVPLVMWHAGLPAARAPVGASLADVGPTVLHFLGLPIPADIDAQSLLAIDPHRVDRPTFSEAFPVRGRELFDSFRLPSLDDAAIERRLRAIRVANRGYEPKGAVTQDRFRLIHHRDADAWLLYERRPGGDDMLVPAGRAGAMTDLLRGRLLEWEEAQRRRIECRLQIKAE